MIDISVLYGGLETPSTPHRYGRKITQINPPPHQRMAVARSAAERRPIVVWNITRTCKVVESHHVPALQASLVTVALCHGLCGIVALFALPAWGSRKRRDWQDAAPYALAWFVAMLFLYWCFALIGPLPGNIVQSSQAPATPASLTSPRPRPGRPRSRWYADRMARKASASTAARSKAAASAQTA